MASSERLHSEVEIESLPRERRGPGILLRQARERGRLSVGSIADTLHLEQRIIEAIEADDYARLPPLIYVRGYLRSYARLVNLPETDILQAFDRVGLEERSRPLTSKVGSSGARGIPTIPAPSTWLLSLAFTAILISGWMFWTQSRSKPEPTTHGTDTAVQADKPSTRQEGTAATAADSAIAPVVGGDADVTIPSAASSKPTVSANAGSAGAVPTAPAQTKSSPGVGNVGPNGARGDMGATNPTGSLEDAASHTDSLPGAQGTSGVATTKVTGVASVTTPASPGGGLETLTVDASGESWVDVQDAAGQHLVYGLLERGENRHVVGRPPFDVTIGDATQITLLHNGARVDLDPYTRGKVARFTLAGTKQE